MQKKLTYDNFAVNDLRIETSMSEQNGDIKALSLEEQRKLVLDAVKESLDVTIGENNPGKYIFFVFPHKYTFATMNYMAQ